ncbi:hypothetical protein ABZ422_20120 [Micromonospora zamorensis]|uniref:Uncharacterized protein n=1 Tax=Micromonospora arida TaxID=2203715 RepID=A0A3N9XHZ6_9ACTN|nr:hypothetical protein [Micromonospora arida]RQX12628.1 hypothetical protein DLJ58_05445 [Micromonospora arida]WSK49907.1 hypothetical protein OG423_05865 [Micromonospora zamorensis]
MNDPAPHSDIPSRAEREALNDALLSTGTESGFWDDTGRPAPWPDDIDDWTPTTSSAQSPIDEIL